MRVACCGVVSLGGEDEDVDEDVDEDGKRGRDGCLKGGPLYYLSLIK